MPLKYKCAGKELQVFSVPNVVMQQGMWASLEADLGYHQVSSLCRSAPCSGWSETPAGATSRPRCPSDENCATKGARRNAASKRSWLSSLRTRM